MGDGSGEKVSGAHPSPFMPYYPNPHPPTQHTHVAHPLTRPTAHIPPPRLTLVLASPVDCRPMTTHMPSSSMAWRARWAHDLTLAAISICGWWWREREGERVVQ